MPREKFACEICGEIYLTREQAEECEEKGLEKLLAVGTVFRYYDSNNSSRVLAVVGASNREHGSHYDFISNLSKTSGATRKDDRMWGITYWFEEDVWTVIRYLAEWRIKPIIAISSGEDRSPANITKYIGIEKMFNLPKRQDREIY